MVEKNKAQINARAETVFDKPMYEHSAQHRRCLVIADGWYEWKGKALKQPYEFCFEDGRPFVFAGRWTRWHGEQPEDGFTIVCVFHGMSGQDSTACRPPFHAKPAGIPRHAGPVVMRDNRRYRRLFRTAKGVDGGAAEVIHAQDSRGITAQLYH